MENKELEQKKENVVLFDWLTFTSHCDSPESIMVMLGLKHVPWQKMDRGRNGYRQRYFYENISILYDGAENMGVCVDMSGTGCRAFETYSTINWKELMEILHYNSSDYNVTRLDMAFDDHTGILDIDVLKDDTDAHMYVSRSRKWKVDYGSEGMTIYHGSPRSDMYIRIYDKAAERQLENVHWIRVELQMRDDIAQGFIAGLMQHDTGTQFRGVLHNYLRYVKQPDVDTNMSRWPMTDYWAELLEGVQRIRCWSSPGTDYNEWNLSNYVINQAGNALDCYLRIFGMDDLIRELGHRSVKMSPKYQRLLQKFEHLKHRISPDSSGDRKSKGKEKTK